MLLNVLLNYCFWQKSVKGTESTIDNIILSKSFKIFARLVGYGSIHEQIVIEIVLISFLENYKHCQVAKPVQYLNCKILHGGTLLQP